MESGQESVGRRIHKPDPAVNLNNLPGARFQGGYFIKHI